MRVLVQRPAIFILDEATASIDPFTEWQIQQALNLILAESTSILIAHRLSTVKAADRIVVMDHGASSRRGITRGCSAQGDTTPRSTIPTSGTKASLTSKKPAGVSHRSRKPIK